MTSAAWGRTKRALATVALSSAVCALIAGCTTPNADPEDPWERMNRGTFAFNEAADQWVIEPVAKGWDFVVPEIAQTGIANFFENLRMPRYVLNNLLQGRVNDAVFELHRFVLNSIFGLGGFIDFAGRIDWEHYPEDFDLTMGHWGVPQGPYLVLPIFGAETVRGTGGLIVDTYSTPATWFVPFYVPLAATTTDMLNKRSIYLGEIAQSREEAFDFYLFVRNAYLQNRKHRMAGGSGDGRSGPFGGAAVDEGGDDEEDLYYFDEDDDSYEEPDEE
jgi:phospholipid-binding lipoprotein MlaA